MRIARNAARTTLLGIIVLAAGNAEAFVPPPHLSRVPVIENFGLTDIAAVFPTQQGGAVIHKNPQLCSVVGADVCGFYMAHEYGHVALGHLSGTAAFRAMAEAQADCWAAKKVSDREFRAAHFFFSNGGGSTRIHGSGPVRAARILACRASP